MSGTQRHTPWPNVYQTKGQCEVSWFQETPAVSLELIHGGVDRGFDYRYRRRGFAARRALLGHCNDRQIRTASAEW
jgi:hypothetical protein